MIAGLLGRAQPLAKRFVYTAANARKKEIRDAVKGKHCLGDERPTQGKYESSQYGIKVHNRHRTGNQRVKEFERQGGRSIAGGCRFTRIWCLAIHMLGVLRPRKSERDAVLPKRDIQ